MADEGHPLEYLRACPGPSAGAHEHARNSSRYGDITSSSVEFLPGEPLFIIRGRDRAAVRAILDYAKGAWSQGAPDAFVRGVNQEAGRFLAWARENANLMKVAD